MRRTALCLAVLLGSAGCGDDGKTAPRGAPAAPPIAPASEPGTPPPAPPAPPTQSPSPSPVPGPTPAAPETSPWARTRVGDWATWEVRVTGSDAVTKLTWQATKVDGTGVRYTAEARTLDLKGVTLSVVSSEELHATGDGPMPDGVPEAIAVAGASIATRRSVRVERGGEVTVWNAPSVPFSGLVRSASATVSQTLVGFGRGP